MGKSPTNKNQVKEEPKFRFTTLITHYLKPNGAWGKRVKDIKEPIGSVIKK